MREKKKKTFWSTHTLISLCVVCREGEKKEKRKLSAISLPEKRKHQTEPTPVIR